ncbi:hypothetical protein AAE02nite_38420 [Adhaeribacter aerolatus]|uniref:Uncharacterized protein n=1 Tax=Adhaeribacter aerolatus TaxID=670289 RepID=A0A512B2K1_9BACT|nr:hypothetical protein [Adhaeribacter aerolatus]GEO06178.1 hypothetical protein AAE02nite_38420 [Adhaeribacter aerolatus]
MDYNRRYSDEDDQNQHPDRRNLPENQRVGKDIYRNRGDQNPADQYRSGQSYHNRNEGFGPNQTHYGARPDSAYRDPNRINYGDNRQNQNRYQDRNQNYNKNQDWNRNQNRNTNDNQNYRSQNTYGDRNQNYYNNPPEGDHAGTRFWGEREGYKQDDYRYTSGNRGNWEAPGIGRNDRDENDRNRYRKDYRPDRHYDQDRDRGFFDRIGDSISNTWNRMTGDDDDNYQNRDRNQHNRPFNRGYESGPRWADEDDRYDRERRNRRRYDD